MIKELLVRLDSLIAQKNTFAMLKEAKIAQLHKLRKDVRCLLYTSVFNHALIGDVSSGEAYHLVEDG